MKKFYPIALLFLLSLSAYADGKQNTDVNQQQKTQAIGISGANVNQNFEAAKPQAQVPQFGINSSSAAVPIFSNATRPASQMFEAYHAAINALNLHRSYFFTDAMFKELEDGMREDRAHASISFEPTEDFVVEKNIAGKKTVAGKHEVVPVPQFVDKLDINGTYLGVINVNSFVNDAKTGTQGLQNTVKGFSHERISVYFHGRKLYMVNIPNGTGINVGVHTDSSTTGIFGSLGAPLGAMAAAIGGSHSESDGDTQYATTLGQGVLVFADKGPVPIHIDFSTQPTEAVVAQETAAQPASQTQEVVVRVKVETMGNSNVPMKQKEGYATTRPRNSNHQHHQQQRYTINE